MCHHFTLPPLRQIQHYLKTDLQLPLTSSPLPALDPEIFPKSLAPVLLYDHHQLHLVPKRWGYPGRRPGQVIFNARVERFFQTRPSMWDQSFARQRCLIIAQQFYEYGQKTYQTQAGRRRHQEFSFASPHAPVTLIAGIYDQDHFAMVTTEPNAVMAPIHNRMPLVIEPSELRRWLFQNFTNLINRQDTPLSRQQLPEK